MLSLLKQVAVIRAAVTRARASANCFIRRSVMTDTSESEQRSYAEGVWAEVLRGSSVTVNAMHPGWADTAGVRSSIPRFHRVTRNILRSPAEGADTVVWLAASPRGREATGRFFFDRTVRSPHLFPHTRESEKERRALWRLCGEWSATPS